MKIHDPCDAIIEARDTQEFSDGIRAVAEHFGFPLFGMILVCSRSGSPQTQWTVANTPPRYLDEFSDPIAGRRDPVLKGMRTTTAPFVWDRASYDNDGTGDLWEIQAPFGYRTGIATAVQLPAGRRAMLGFNSHDPIRGNARSTKVLLAQLAMLATLAAQSAERVLANDLAKEQELGLAGQALSMRERQSLYWASRGLTDEEIGRVLGVSPSTARKFMAGSIRKLGSTNRTRAVVDAAKLGIIDDHLSVI